MKKIFRKIYEYVINPPGDEELSKAWQVSHNKLPTLWLLGKTGSGKSSIVQKMTGETAAEIGNGFMPCTQDASGYDYPADLPIIRFMDTRGLGESAYNPAEDLASLGGSSQALLIVMRLRDGEQSSVLDAIKEISESDSRIRREHAVVVHTAASEISDEHDRQRAVAEKQAMVEKIWGKALDHCVVDFSETTVEGELNDFGADALNDIISKKMPALTLWLQKNEHEDNEQANFGRLRAEVLSYAGVAAASDTLPAVGLFSVPAIQGKMLHSLAQHYGIEWNVRNFTEFTGALGVNVVLWYAASFGGRQLVKMIPAYGQIVGGAVAFTVSYTSTYAIGRAACSYLYHKKTNTPLPDNALEDVYKEAMKQSKAAKKELKQERNT